MTNGLIWAILGLGIGGALTRVLDPNEKNKGLYIAIMVALAAAIIVLKFYVKI